MKIIRLKRGYRINLTDGEFEALTQLVNHGASVLGDYEKGDGWREGLSEAAERALQREFFPFGRMSVTDDRRGS